MINLLRIAVDPGVSGGYCFKTSGGQVFPYKFTTNGDFIDHVNTYSNGHQEIHSYIENVPPFIGFKKAPQSVGFKLGKSCGFYEGALMAFNTKVHMIRPAAWIKALSLGSKKDLSSTQWKNKLKSEAQRLYPRLKVNLAISDALLILAAAERIYLEL